MKIIKPLAVTDAMLVSSTVAEPSASDPAAWNAATAYAVGDRVTRTTTHRVYERLTAGTTAEPPETDLTGTAPRWKDYGPTNRWACFDEEIGTQTSGASPLTIVLQPGQFNGLALFELQGTQLEVTVRDGSGGPIVYTRTVSLEDSIVADWYAYFFEPFSQRGSVILLDLPPYASAHLTITITGGATCKVGAIVLGTVYTIGSTEGGAEASLRDFSRKVVDEQTGRVSLSEGRFRKELTLRVLLDGGAANVAQRLLESLRATPLVAVGDDEGAFEALSTYGFFRDMRLNVAGRSHAYYSIQFEGFI